MSANQIELLHAYVLHYINNIYAVENNTLYDVLKNKLQSLQYTKADYYSLSPIFPECIKLIQFYSRTILAIRNSEPEYSEIYDKTEYAPEIEEVLFLLKDRLIDLLYNDSITLL